MPILALQFTYLKLSWGNALNKACHKNSHYMKMSQKGAAVTFVDVMNQLIKDE